MDIHDCLAKFQPCTVFLAQDMGTFTSYFVGAYVDGVYCTSGISSFVYELMITSLCPESSQRSASSPKDQGCQG